MTIDLNDCTPQRLLSEASLDDLLEAARQVEGWTTTSAGVLDFVYRHTLVGALRSRRSENLLAAFSRHVRRVLTVGRRRALAQLDPDYAARWEGYAELADGQLAALANRDPGILERAHVRRVLAEVAKKPTAQKELGLRLQVKEANLTRVLNLMERHDLVERRQRGRENEIHLGASPLVDEFVAGARAARPGARPGSLLLNAASSRR